MTTMIRMLPLKLIGDLSLRFPNNQKFIFIYRQYYWVFAIVISFQLFNDIFFCLSSSPHGFTNSQFPNFEFRIFGLACFLFVKTIIRDWELGLCETICYILRRSQKVDGIFHLVLTSNSTKTWTLRYYSAVASGGKTPQFLAKQLTQSGDRLCPP